MKAKETWIEETLDSLDGIRRATPQQDLFPGILKSAGHPGKKTNPVKRPFYWSVAAAIVILITLNIFGAFYYHQFQSTSGKVPAAIAKDYLSYLGPIKL
jgi:thiosulfate reductase cytochrome b subunit